MPSTAGLAALALVAGAHAQNYALKAMWQGSTFFEAFDFFTGADPTNGFVEYVNMSTAMKNGLISTTAKTAYMGVDYTTTLAASGSQGGRQSVRLSSVESFTEGLFIGDFEHMPGGICGTWPAFWTLGPDWPSNGEIDIVEGVNSAAANLMSLHTGPNCTTAGTGETGTLEARDCYEYSQTEDESGCGVQDGRADSYGAAFNANSGGVYAMEWTAGWIRVYMFPRGAVPADIAAGKPVPSSWGQPVANFQGGCNVPAHFASHNVIFDTTFCGDYAGNVWSSDANCKNLASSCNAYVAQNPGAFKNAYWLVNYVAVYQATASTAAAASDAVLPSQPVTAASSVAHGAAGATGAPPAGVTPVAPVEPSVLNQVPATENATAATGELLGDVEGVLEDPLGVLRV